MTTPDTSTTEGKISVMKAFADGKKIELISKTWNDAVWAKVGNPNWNWEVCDYRIKPEPLECWVNVHELGLRVFSVKDFAETAPGDIPIRRAVHMREVTE